MPAGTRSTLLVATLLAAGLLLPGCDNDGPAEQTGERIDETIDEATKGVKEPFEQGPAEQAGEKLDEATGQ